MIRYNIDQFLQRPVLHQWLQNGKIYRVSPVVYLPNLHVLNMFWFTGSL